MAADVKIEVIRQAVNTSTGNQDFTFSTGFGTPVACMFFLTAAYTADTIQTDASFCFGFTDGTNDAQISAWSEDTGSNTNTGRDRGTVAIARAWEGASNTCALTFVSFGTDKVTLNVGVASSNALILTVVGLTGADIANVYVGNSTASTGGTDVTAPGFEPDLVFFGANGGTGASVHSIYSIGVAHNDGAATQRGLYHSGRDNLATAVVNDYIDSDGCAAQVYNNGVSYTVACGSFDASGFTLTASSNPSTDVFDYLALKFTNSPDIKVFDVDAPAAGNYAETTPGFTPIFGMIALSDATARDTLQTDKDGFSVTVFDDTTTSANAFREVDATTTGEADSYSGTQLAMMDGSGIIYDADFSAFDADGWDFTVVTNPGAARKGWGLAIGVGAAGGGGRIMSSLAANGGLAGMGGIAGQGGGLAG